MHSTGNVIRLGNQCRLTNAELAASLEGAAAGSMEVALADLAPEVRITTEILSHIVSLLRPALLYTLSEVRPNAPV